MSNQKQWSTAILMYVGDYDETYPLSMSFNPATNSWFTGPHDTPSNWRLTNTAQIARHASYWTNAVLSYMKTAEIAYCPSTEEVDLAGADYSNPKAPLIYNTYDYNGLLSQFPEAQVSNPASVILLTEGTGKARLKGYGRANPQLSDCGADSTCQYKAKVGSSCATESGAPAPGGRSSGTTGYKTYLIHNGGMNFAYADGHVKWQKLGPTGAATTNAAADPWLNYNADGIGGSRHIDGCHSCLMRPYVNPGATQVACLLP